MQKRNTPKRVLFQEVYRPFVFLVYGKRDSRLKIDSEIPKEGKKLLLPNPESDGFQENMMETSGNEHSSKDYIRRLTGIAQYYGIHVKWYDFFQRQTMPFYDTESPETAWVLVTITQNYADVDARPKYRHTKKDKPDEYNDKLAYFNKVWECKSKSFDAPDLKEAVSLMYRTS